MFRRMKFLAVFVLVFGLMAVGCITIVRNTVSYLDTETSQEIFRAASALLSSRGDRITIGALASELRNRFPGLIIKDYSGLGILVTYNDNDYLINCEFEAALVRVVVENTIVVEIVSVKQRIQTEPSSE